MLDVLQEKGMKNVMMDCYADDPHIPDASFIAKNALRSATHGSIIILHMPEQGFREWEVQGLVKSLEILDAKHLRSVTLSELEAAANKQKVN